MAYSEFEKKRIEKIVGRYIEEKRPPAEIRDEVDLSFKIEGQSIEIFEIRPLWDDPKEKIEEPVAKATYVKSRNLWKVFWQRADLKWHRYDPDPEVDTIDDFLEVVEQTYNTGWSIKSSMKQISLKCSECGLIMSKRI
jgi:spore coat polysaccharide biosynthesis protein SpsF (cytidylyltransferase family)